MNEKSRIDTLETRQDEQATRIDRLEERIAALEKYNEEHPPSKKVARLTQRTT